VSPFSAPSVTASQRAAGGAREAQEQRADHTYAQIEAPPCTACGALVKDKDWDRHRYEAHGLNDGVRPYGKADSREALFVGADTSELERKIQAWRSRRSGVDLRWMAEGKDKASSTLWVRYRVTSRRSSL